MKKANVITSVILMILSIFVFYQASQFPTLGGEDVTGPDLFPKALAVLLIFLSVLLLCSTIANPFSDHVKLWGKGSVKAFMTMGTIAIYLAMLKWLGFFIGTLIFLSALIHLLGQKTYIRTFVLSLGITIIIFWVSRTLLFVPLPTGKLFG